jgi:hypothetical protein
MKFRITLIRTTYLLAEGVGFEPTELSLNGFQDRRLKPLGHPSITRLAYYHLPVAGSMIYDFTPFGRGGWCGSFRALFRRFPVPPAHPVHPG